jgi:hypothetical protein
MKQNIKKEKTTFHLPISQTQQKRTPFNLQKPPYKLSSGVAEEAFVSSFPSIQKEPFLCA